MKRSIRIALATCLLLAACKSGEQKAKEEKAVYEKQKASLADREKEQPKDFITVSGHDRRNLIGQTVVKIKLVSKAAVAVYKDVEVELAFFSKTGTLLEKDTEIVYETLPPGSDTHFKTKYFAPKGTDSVALKVLSAKVAE